MSGSPAATSLSENKVSGMMGICLAYTHVPTGRSAVVAEDAKWADTGMLAFTGFPDA